MNRQPPHCCNGCADRWGGQHTCHCSACHLTFCTIHAFDRHRRGGDCLDPAVAGLVQSNRSYECWGRPFSLTVDASERLSRPSEGNDPRGTFHRAQISGTGDVA